MVSALLPLGQTLSDLASKLDDILNIFTSVFDSSSSAIRTESKIDSCVLNTAQPSLVVSGSVLANVNDPIDVKVIESVPLNVTGDVGITQPLVVEWAQPMPVTISEQPLYVQWDESQSVKIDGPVDVKVVNTTPIDVSVPSPLDVKVTNTSPIAVSQQGRLDVTVGNDVTIVQPITVQGEVKVKSDGPLDVTVINDVKVKNTDLGGTLSVNVEGGDVDVHGDVGVNFNVLGGGIIQMDAYIAEVVGAIGASSSAITSAIGGVVSAETATTSAVGATTAAVAAASTAIAAAVASSGAVAHTDAGHIQGYLSDPIVPMYMTIGGNYATQHVGKRVSDIVAEFESDPLVSATIPASSMQPSGQYALGQNRLVTSSHIGNAYAMDGHNV